MKKQPYTALLIGSLISLCPLPAVELAQEVEVKKENQSPADESISQNKQILDQGEEAVTQAPVRVEEFELIVDSKKGAVIDEIITTMGTSSVIGLGFKKGHLKALGRKLDGVGPLQFLGYIFSKDSLKAHMKSIRKSSMKWNGFMDGLKPGLNREASTKELHEKLPAFAQIVKVRVEPLKVKADDRDWNGFVSYLVEN